MKKNIVAGNWKMNTSLEEGIALLNEIQAGYKEIDSSVELIIAPPFTHLTTLVKLSQESSNLSIAAQNCAAEEEGAFTGEVSAKMIGNLGVSYVILGHSERRKHYQETDNTIKKKIDLALKFQLRPIFCCGESIEERTADEHFEVVTSQVENALFHLDESNFGKIIVAYEPVWAIGTGETATPDQAQEMHAHIRKLITNKYGTDTSEQVAIIYGGSCNPENAKKLFANSDVDGGLIGGASLEVSDFINIAKSFND
ncbi:MAG: triose-phosphate isomerase [Bacteroidetes bacterium]|nr:MAG: triose-phosphate isomerase [Bacteroidota bacterium]